MVYAILIAIAGAGIAACYVLAGNRRSKARDDDPKLNYLGRDLEAKTFESEGHSKRVTAFTIAIARSMGLPKEEIGVIARGAFLHDIGRIAIPDATLRKRGELSPDELAVMRQHCVRGYQIVKRIPFLANAAEIVYSHHERFDGTCYPRGLKGAEIPLGSRIFAVADTLDAITSNPFYNTTQGITVARAEIKRLSGAQFDPEVVKIFLELPEKIWEDLRRGIDGQPPQN